ncbi:hypothetical protein [Micromonospora sp. RL09-050-HVF-A]|uniref:hypothetical protein n=1 Tax=Micromonospora sp. RL09-050-HVF-A TaxID=1703433 RepID=UPI0021073C9E|nr:hypothetical protein [Micromonospora sp. RL09-050-HVF-A]
MVDEILWSLRSACPIPPRLSPYAEGVQDWLLDRLPRLGLPLGTEALHRLDRAGFARYAGRLYPDASEPDLRTVAALFTWFFLVDDACDGPDRLPSEQIRALRRGTLTLLHDGPRRRHPNFGGPLRRLLVEAWRAPAAGCRRAGGCGSPTRSATIWTATGGRRWRRRTGGCPGWPSTSRCAGPPRRRTCRIR